MRWKTLRSTLYIVASIIKFIENMKRVINLTKTVGQTSLECLQEFVENNPEYLDQKLGYAGTLDPMASGVLLILVGEENKKRQQYLNLKKEYEFEILFGVATDTYDILGIIKDFENIEKEKIENLRNLRDKNQLNLRLKKFKGKILQDLPPFSSTIIKGHPLFWWARQNKLGELSLEPKERTIYKIELLDFYEKNSKTINKEILENIKKVRGNFRQEDIKKEWEKFFEKYDSKVLVYHEHSRRVIPSANKSLAKESIEGLPRRVASRNDNRWEEKKFQIAKIKVQVSKGTYVRQLAIDIGKELGVPALAYSIKRTRVGKYGISLEQ